MTPLRCLGTPCAKLRLRPRIVCVVYGSEIVECRYGEFEEKTALPAKKLIKCPRCGTWHRLAFDAETGQYVLKLDWAEEGRK